MILTDVIYGRKKSAAPSLKPNTFIGGVAAEIPTAAALATKLNILESDISYFAEDGVDIEARIEVEYSIDPGAFSFLNFPDIVKYFIDEKCIVLKNSAFKGQSNLEFVDFLNVVSIGLECFQDSGLKKAIFKNVTGIDRRIFWNSKLIILYAPNLVETLDNTSASLWCFSPVFICLYAPKLKKIGLDAGFQNFFYGVQLQEKKLEIWVDPTLSTSNNGQEEGDINYARTNLNAEINYNSLPNDGVVLITNPSNPINLSISLKYATALQINFTPPTHTNTIDYYEVWLNGSKHDKIKNSGDYIIGLTPSTTYNIQLIAVDEFYNKSELSDAIVENTNALAVFPTTGLISYYALEELTGDVIDSHGSNHGTNYGATREVVGKIGNGFSFDGVDDWVNLNQPSLLNNSTLSFWFYSKSNDRQNILDYGGYTSWGSFNFLADFDGTLRFYYTPNNSGSFTFITHKLKPSINSWHHVALVRDHTNSKYLFFIDGVKVEHITSATSAKAPSGVLKIGDGYAGNFNGIIDELAIYNKSLSHGEISDLYNNGNGITL